MNRKQALLFSVGVVLLPIAATYGQPYAMGTAFTYQGQLTDAGSPANGLYDFEFKLCDDASATCEVDASTVADYVDDHQVDDGLFTVEIDFGSDVFNGQARWLELGVRPGASSGADPYTTLSPRQKLTPSPHALALPGLWTQQNATSPNLVGGYSGNSVGGGVVGATIGGGGSPLYEVNRVTDDYGSVGGGAGNQAGSDDGFTTTQTFATVGGGQGNTAGAYDSTVGGGAHNATSANYSTIGGGGMNIASAVAATVPGGWLNTAAGTSSLAAGLRAKANHDGTFVWGDSTFADFASTGADQFLIRAGGGVGIGKNNPSEQLDVEGNIHASGTITSGSSITIDGTAGSENITSTADLELHVTSGRALRVAANATSPNLIGGYSGNSVTTGVLGATIAGGGQSAGMNRVTDWFGTVGGGWNNQAGDGDASSSDERHTTIGGGAGNTASSGGSTIGGGIDNTASGAYGSIGGGSGNTANGTGATIGGGVGNTSWSWATVPGGLNNAAAGQYSFAAGYRAKVRSPADVGGGDPFGDEGTFVWADSTNADFASTGPDQFLIRAGGGVGIGKNNPSEQLDVEGNIHASGTITSGSSITVDGTNHRLSSTGPLEIHVGGARLFRMVHDPTSPNLLAGYSGNSVTSGVKGATIGGGGSSMYGRNRVTDDYGTVAGGHDNQAGDDTGATDSVRATTVGGGYSNMASGSHSTIAGGYNNTANGGNASIGGGGTNIASGQYATVPGGDLNTAAGRSSFAAGRRAKANHNGAFVWGDSTDADFASERADQFRVRANGGARFDDGAEWVNIYDDGTDLITTSTGAHLTLGGVWTDNSDRDRKDDQASVDIHEVLRRVSTLPVSTWHYTVEDPSVRHMGAMAQDFYAAFGLGNDERHIAALDTGGVALAAIQGLYEIVKEKEAKIEALRAQNDAQVAELEARLTALENLVKQADAGQQGGRR